MRFPVASLAMILAAGPAACTDRVGQGVATAGAGSTWRWRATSMELSALSSPLRAVAAPAELDARVEFFDSDRDETKALGRLSVTAFFDGNPIGTAEADLADPATHARCWDSVTETYSLRMVLSVEPQPGRVVVLKSGFEGVDGARMTASREVRWPETGR